MAQARVTKPALIAHLNAAFEVVIKELVESSISCLSTFPDFLYLVRSSLTPTKIDLSGSAIEAESSL